MNVPTSEGVQTISCFVMTEVLKSKAQCRISLFCKNKVEPFVIVESGITEQFNPEFMVS